MVHLRLGAIVEALGGELSGDASTLITALAPLESASPSELSFLSNPRYQQQLAASQAAYTQDGDHRRYPRAMQVAGAVLCVVLAATLPWTSVLGGVLLLAVGALWRLLRPRALR